MVYPLIALMVEAARTSEMLVNFYQTTRLYNPEDNHLRTHRRENLRSYYMFQLNAAIIRCKFEVIALELL
jgi:hypothetical protein